MGHEDETFRNRFDPASLAGADRLLAELGGATNAQVGALGEETVAVVLEDAGAIVVTMGDAGLERDAGRQDLDLVAVIDGELVALEVKARYFSKYAGRLTRAGNLSRPRMRSGSVQARQASQEYVAARIADVIDLDGGFAGMEVRVAAVDFVAMAVQFFSVDDSGRRLTPLGPPQPCWEAADVALARILEHRGHL
jgi:Holliday junction resolvase-like predicted endonuclease